MNVALGKLRRILQEEGLKYPFSYKEVKAIRLSLRHK